MEKIFKKWAGVCRMFNRKEDPAIYSHKELFDFAKTYHEHMVQSSFNAAINHVKESQCNLHLDTPYLLLGDVSEVIKILTGKEVNWKELEVHSR